ncbi:hypothetical protein AB0L56_02265 [Streptomyces sp. NPDC052079]|uniref:hypothetical protein n=1 Tax=Streptomyces sp. NPDC052079 TaxID=3155526 RepID=UPI00342DCEF5
MGIDLWNKYGADQEEFHSEMLKMIDGLRGTDKVLELTSSGRHPPSGGHPYGTGVASCARGGGRYTAGAPVVSTHPEGML